MAEAEARTLPWLRIIVEGTVIVGSILLAFGIDAAWDERGERAREAEALQALSRDFTSADSVLRAQVLVIDSAAAAASAILELVGPGADEHYVDSLAVLIPLLIRRPTFRPPMGTLEALLGSGDLRVIGDALLKAELASFPSKLASMRETQGYGSEIVFGLLLPYLDARVPMLRFGLMARGQSDFSGDPVGVLRSLEFENLVQNRMMGIQFARGAADEMATRISTIRDLLEKELSD